HLDHRVAGLGKAVDHADLELGGNPLGQALQPVARCNVDDGHSLRKLHGASSFAVWGCAPSSIEMPAARRSSSEKPSLPIRISLLPSPTTGPGRRIAPGVREKRPTTFCMRSSVPSSSSCTAVMLPRS